MCNICLKYKCPNGCPNNYTPRENKINRQSPLQIRGFSLIVEIGEKGVKPAADKIKKEYR